MKLKLNECACSRRGTVYCRTPKGYRFTGKKCSNPGKKVKSKKAKS